MKDLDESNLQIKKVEATPYFQKFVGKYLKKASNSDIVKLAKLLNIEIKFDNKNILFTELKESDKKVTFRDMIETPVETIEEANIPEDFSWERLKNAWVEYFDCAEIIRQLKLMSPEDEKRFKIDAKKEIKVFEQVKKLLDKSNLDNSKL